MRHALALCSLFSVYFSSVLVCSVAADVSEHSGGVVKCPPAPCNPPNGTAAVPQLHALPADGAVVSGTSSLAVQWSVQCIAYPCASYVVYWDVNGGDEDALVPGVRIDGATSLSLHNLEPGSYFLRLTLHDAATDEQLAAHVSSLEVVPVAAPAVDPVYVSMTQAAAGPGGDPTPLPLPRGVAEDAVPAPAVLFVGDTATFDGMKSFLVDYMAAFARRGSHVGYLDATCMAPDVDTAGVFASPPAPGATFPSPVAQAVLAVPGVRFMRWCVQCPRQLCSSASDFDAFVDRHGPLPNAASWDDLPAAWAALLRPLGDVIGSFDAMVMAWTEDKPQGRGMYLSHVGRLSNPALVRVVDLGPGYERLPEEFWSADAFTVPSNFVKLRPTVTATGMEAIVMQPLIDARRFRPDATHVSADSCARKYGKLVGTDGGVLVGFVARVTSTKGPGMFVRAAAEVVKRLPNARFVMVGQPRQHVYMEHLQWLVDKLGLTRHVRVRRMHPTPPPLFACLTHVCVCAVFCCVCQVRMFGFLPRHELMDLYACMDVLLCTSLTNYETFGIVNAVRTTPRNGGSKSWCRVAHPRCVFLHVVRKPWPWRCPLCILESLASKTTPWTACTASWPGRGTRRRWLPLLPK